jgi:hypothetical protein
MTKIRIMYWKEIPVQVQASDETQTMSSMLDDKFQQAADAISMMDGSVDTDSYLDGWQWGEYENTSYAIEVALKMKVACYNEKMPKDFVSRIRDSHNNGTRIPNPGAIDYWIQGDQVLE